jgi:hypothetical protein
MRRQKSQAKPEEVANAFALIEMLMEEGLL